MADTRILIVVNDVEAGNAYTRALAELGVEYDIVPSFQEMSVMAIENAYNGLVIDILTLVRCSKDEKVIAYDCINLYPVLRVKWETKQKKIKLSPLEQSFSPNAESALRFFIETRCRSFSARPLRRHKRKQIHLNVLQCPDNKFWPENTLKTFTVTVSPAGVFIHTLLPFQKADTVWLRFTDFADQTPIAATVRWSLQWGESRNIPGIGLQFDEISQNQVKEIQALY